MRSNSGFTVIELLVALAVAAILLALAAPSFSTMFASYRLTAGTNDLVNAAGLARSEAIKRNRSVTLCRTDAAGDDTCAAAEGTWDNWIIVAPGPEVIRRGEPGLTGSNLRIESAFASESLSYAPDGSPGQNAAFTVCTSLDVPDNRRIVDIGPGSHISTLRESGTCP